MICFAWGGKNSMDRFVPGCFVLHVCFEITLLLRRRLTGTFFQHKISFKNYLSLAKLFISLNLLV